MAQINEKETSFELVEALLKYIETLQVAGAVLIFLPGWNLIYSMQRHLETNPHFGTPARVARFLFAGRKFGILVTVGHTATVSLCSQEAAATESCRCTRRSPGRSSGGCLSRCRTTSPRFGPTDRRQSCRGKGVPPRSDASVAFFR